MSASPGMRIFRAIPPEVSMTGERYAIAFEIKTRNQGQGIARQLTLAVESTLRKWCENTHRIKMDYTIIPTPGKEDRASAYILAINIPCAVLSRVAGKRDLEIFRENLKKPDYQALQQYLTQPDSAAWKQILLGIIEEKGLADLETLDNAGYNPAHLALDYFRALRDKPVGLRL